MQQEYEIKREDLKLSSIPPEVFEIPLIESETTDRVTNQDKIKFIDMRQEYPKEGGTYRHYFGCRAPEKGVIEPRIVLANDRVKAMTVGLLAPYMTKDLLLSLFSWKAKIRFLERWLFFYRKNADQYLRFVFLRPERYCPCCQEFRKLIFLFLKNLGIKEDLLSDYTAKVWVTLVEYDSQYKYPLQDWFSSTTKESMLKNPIKEIWKVNKITEKRDKAPLRHEKVVMPFKLLSYLLIHPKIRKAWKSALKEIDFARLQFDEDDFYFCITRYDYDYGGLGEEKRREIWMEIHNNNAPPMMEFTNAAKNNN